MELPENIGINEHGIELIVDKQLPYGPIYSLAPVGLEILKTYIKTHLKTWFIRPFKSPAGALIFLIRSQTEAFACVSIIEAWTTSQSKISTLSFWWMNPWIG